MVKVEVINSFVFFVPDEDSSVLVPLYQFHFHSNNHIIYLNWKSIPSFMQSCHGCLLPPDSPLSLPFGDCCLGADYSVQIFVILSFLFLNRQSFSFFILAFVIWELTKCLF